MSDLYTVLGVDRSADLQAIRAAYRALARRCHPDSGGDQQAMTLLNKAWHVLGDPARRAAYDASIRIPSLGSIPPGPTTPRPVAHRQGATVLDFGRYEGWALTQIAAADDDYLVWLSRTPMGRPLRDEIQAVLDARDEQLAALRPAFSTRQPAWGRR